MMCLRKIFLFVFYLNFLLLNSFQVNAFELPKKWCSQGKYSALVKPFPKKPNKNCPEEVSRIMSLSEVKDFYFRGFGKDFLCAQIKDGTLYSPQNKKRNKYIIALIEKENFQCAKIQKSRDWCIGDGKFGKQYPIRKKQKCPTHAAIEITSEDAIKILLTGSGKKYLRNLITSGFICKNNKLEYGLLRELLKGKKDLGCDKKKTLAEKKADEEERKRKEFDRRLATLEKKQKKQQQIKPTIVIENKPKSEFPKKPILINFPPVSAKRDDIAVIIGNANYKKLSIDIPNVNPAYADAEGIKQYFIKAKGIKEGNIIYLRDATGSQLVSIFGNEKSYKGKLYNYIKPNKSNVYIYYAGHGAPGEDGDAYLVPSDTDAQSVKLTGYQLSTLYSNLSKLPAKSMTVILEACFSGGSQSGSLISKASPIFLSSSKTSIPHNIKLITAGASDQMASWEQDSSHSLFTKYFLKAMSGEGDTNKDGKVSDTELKEYLSDTMTYYARRYYGRDQKVQIHNGR